MESAREEITWKNLMAYVEAAYSLEERALRKMYVHSYLYGNKQSFAEFIKCKQQKK